MIPPRLHRSKLVQGLLLVFMGYCIGSIRKYLRYEYVARSNLIHIGFITDGQNIGDINNTIKTLFLNRQSLDFLTFHILASKNDWPQIDQIFQAWSKIENGSYKSFRYSLYDLAECGIIQTIFEPYFDAVYRTAFCKLIFPYIVNPEHVPYLLLLDFDIVILNSRFTENCWVQTIDELENHPLALFSIGHQGSPLGKKRNFPMPYIDKYKAYFHFNNGVVLFHVARIHALDSLPESHAYPVSMGPRRWLRDVQNVSLDYFHSSQRRYSLSQIIWNIYMTARPHCFVQLNQGCNFQPCASHTNVQLRDIQEHYPNIIVVHIWRTCLRQQNNVNDFFISYYNALTHLPIEYINRINPTGFI